MKPIGAFELQGHRGARGLFAENTLEGFRRALDFGLDSIELDIAVTADDVAVVVHDPVLNVDLTRTRDGAWLAAKGIAVRSLSLAALRGFDVGRARPGSATARAHPDQVSFDGACIPTLAEVFTATAAWNVRIDAELKTNPATPDTSVSPAAMAQAVVDVAHACAALPRLAVRSFDWRGLAFLRRCHPTIPLAWLSEGQSDAAMAERVADAAQSCPYQPTWAPLAATLDRAALDRAHALGLRVVPWTVNGPADMARLIDWGIDGLCTDRPDLLRALMSERLGA